MKFDRSFTSLHEIKDSLGKLNIFKEISQELAFTYLIILLNHLVESCSVSSADSSSVFTKLPASSFVSSLSSEMGSLVSTLFSIKLSKQRGPSDFILL